MKKIIFLFSAAALMACGNNTPKTPEEASDEAQAMTEEPLMGGDEDEHGCKPSTGESWSELQQRCIRVFDKGERLNPIEDNGTVISAFALFNTDKSKVEIFTSMKENTILDKKGDNLYEGGNFKYDSAEGVLYIDGKEAFKKEASSK